MTGFKEWICEKRKVEPQSADKDVFGDGTVMMLRTPGHTPGHSMPARPPEGEGPGGPAIGDAAHFHENYENEGVPGFNYDRAQTIASIERIKQIDEEPEGDGDHPARPARHRQAAGLSGRREVVVISRSEGGSGSEAGSEKPMRTNAATIPFDRAVGGAEW